MQPNSHMVSNVPVSTLSKFYFFIFVLNRMKKDFFSFYLIIFLYLDAHDISFSFGSLRICILPRDYHHTMQLEASKTNLHENTMKNILHVILLGIVTITWSKIHKNNMCVQIVRMYFINALFSLFRTTMSLYSSIKEV